MTFDEGSISHQIGGMNDQLSGPIGGLSGCHR
jgi:hypothetical protein